MHSPRHDHGTDDAGLGTELGYRITRRRLLTVGSSVTVLVALGFLPPAEPEFAAQQGRDADTATLPNFALLPDAGHVPDADAHPRV